MLCLLKRGGHEVVKSEIPQIKIKLLIAYYKNFKLTLLATLLGYLVCSCFKFNKCISAGRNLEVWHCYLRISRNRALSDLVIREEPCSIRGMGGRERACVSLLCQFQKWHFSTGRKMHTRQRPRRTSEIVQN